MENTYNVKFKEYSEQTVVSIYDKDIVKRDVLDNIIIQIKKYRSMNAYLLLEEDNGVGVYGCDWIYLDGEIKMQLFDNDLEDFYDFVCLKIPSIFRTQIKSDMEKEERSINTSLSRTKQKVYDLAYSNDWSLFVTLTFDDKKLAKKYGVGAWDYDACVKALHSFFTMLKRNYPQVAYLGVGEHHHTFYNTMNGDVVEYDGKVFKDKDYNVLLNKQNRTLQEQEMIDRVLDGTYKRRFHFHFLFNNFPMEKLIDGGKRTSKGQVVYNLLNYKLGFTEATMIQSLQGSQYYITKYISKDLVGVSKGKKRYWASQNLNKPKESTCILDIEEKKELQEELIDTIETSTRIKDIKVENDNFTNTIHKYIIKDWEVYKNQTLEEYIDINDKVKVIELPSCIKDLNHYVNIESIFDPFLNIDYCYIKHNNKFYKYNKINGRGVVSDI